jgi:hypothetical protein
MDDIKALPKNPPTNPAAEREPESPRKEPNLDRAIDDETGGLIRPSEDDVRTEKRPDDEQDR